MSASHSFSLQISTIFILYCLSFVAQADVPIENRLKFVNEGDYGYKMTDFGAWYRALPEPLHTFPFTLCFYNTTPYAYKFGMVMGDLYNDDILLFVWDANRSNPVGENATITFGADGNLVLAEADGQIAWETNTANKGVVDISLLANGNLVLQDIDGGIVWQSFDYPTDTLLMGQPLRRNGTNKIVSRVSKEDGSEGEYSLVLGKSGVTLSLKSKNSPTPIPYFALSSKNMQEFAFRSFPVSFGSNDYQLGFEFTGSNSSTTFNFTQTTFNSTLSFIHIHSNGNIYITTFNAEAQDFYWSSTYAIFNRYVGLASECQLPWGCGSLGVCKNNDCVACPTAKGLTGWNQNTCRVPILPPCRGGANLTYYKVVGVDHFSIKKGDGPMSINKCKKKCDKDCGCLAFFYRKKTSKCLLVPELGTLTQVPYPSHVGYIKMTQ